MSRKRALIIGNNTYSNGPLEHCISDAAAFAAALREVSNCEPQVEQNLKSDDMLDKVNSFIMSIKPNDFVIFYFSGYALKWRDQNFLLSCDNDKIITMSSVQRYGINAQAVIDDIASRNPQVVIFLFDCCGLHLSSNKTSTITFNNQETNHLSEMIATDKTIIGFAFAVTKESCDQSKMVNRGLFTKCFIQHMKKSGVNIETCINIALRDVLDKTNHTQQVFRSSRFFGEIFLAEAGKIICNHFFRSERSFSDESKLDGVISSGEQWRHEELTPRRGYLTN